MLAGRTFQRAVSVATVARRGFAAPAAATAAAQLVLNFTTPHAPVYAKKTVEVVSIPGAAGEYGVTAGHSPIISELKPGVVTVVHTGGATEKFFVPGGFAITHADSVTDISVPEAVPLADLDDAAIRAGYAAAVSASAAATDGSVAKATAMIEIETFAAMARAAGFSV